MLSIGDLARDTGVKVPTIRYYEQMGLMAAAGRSYGNQRRYEPSDRERLAFIKHARGLGFSLDDIRELLDLNAHPDQPCAHADDIAERQLSSVRQKIAQLRLLEDELERIVSHPHGDQVRDCYVIRSLANHGLCQHDH
jgi:DNA-binding transcriptional MerR regulator